MGSWVQGQVGCVGQKGMDNVVGLARVDTNHPYNIAIYIYMYLLHVCVCINKSGGAASSEQWNVNQGHLVV